MFTMPTASFDLRKEIEMQSKRLEEMKVITNPITQDKKDDQALVDKKPLPVIQQTPAKKKLPKLVLTVNTNHCRAELDTLQYVIDKHGFKETTQAGDGNILW